MRRLLEYILQSRWRTLFAALLFSLLPFLRWIGSAIMATITLHAGPKTGFYLLLWITLPSIMFLLQGDYLSLISLLLLGNGFIWLIAVLLRATDSWHRLLQFNTLIGLIVLGGVYLFTPNINEVWYTTFLTLEEQLGIFSQLPLTEVQKDTTLHTMANMATGLLITTQLLINLGILFIARWWQAILYNPGGLRREVHAIRLSRWETTLLAACLTIASTTSVLPLDIIPLLMMPLFLAGISLVHALIAKANRFNRLYLLLFYIAIIFMPPYMGVALILAAIADSWFNFRYRLNHTSNR